jgi:hypothetical protein
MRNKTSSGEEHLPKSVLCGNHRLTPLNKDRLIQRLSPWMLELLTELLPSGYVSDSGDYWIVVEFELRISLKTGCCWSRTGDSRKPIWDIIELWRMVKGYEDDFRAGIKALEQWCAERELRTLQRKHAPLVVVNPPVAKERPKAYSLEQLATLIPDEGCSCSQWLHLAQTQLGSTPESFKRRRREALEEHLVVQRNGLYFLNQLELQVRVEIIKGRNAA